MNQEIRNRLRNVVTQCRKLLEESVSQELEGKYGIFAKKDHVTADPSAPMTHLTEEEQGARKDILDHFTHIKARGFKPKEALDQLVREIAFTHLNRLCAYKMMEAREVYIGGQKFREAVSRGIDSNGVKFYLADHPDDERLYNTGHQDIAYRHFLNWLGGLLSGEIGVLFNPDDSANRLYPKQTILDDVLGLLNNGGIKPEETELREAWPKIWSQDETIGWVYQYFTPKELRDAARDPKKGGSQAPRNSYELAFRNQFFTPRYVVEFLTDNTLGRIWYEMRKGQTKLREQCRYMVRRPNEVFLQRGEQPPKATAEGRNDLSQEELLSLPVHVPHRPKKDPRELKVLDPASGSGHFLLYCFDLLQVIYEEAYTDQELAPALQRDYPTLDALKRDVPRLILAHNVHGVDIDLRCSQIAALAMWLRCQRAYQDMGLKKERPKITRSNFVCAEPMPGEEPMLKDFIAQLEPRLLGQLVEVVFHKMKLAGEAGSLLKIEKEIHETIAQAKRQWLAGPISIQQSLFDEIKPAPNQQRFDFSGVTDTQFFEQAEAKLVEALRRYAEAAHNGERFRRRLFSEDAVRGFAFVDMCQRRYDVVLMNPPFGESTPGVGDYITANYEEHSNNILCAFVLRAIELLTEGGAQGAIVDKTAWVKSSYGSFRERLLTCATPLTAFADLGWDVLDGAQVEAAAFTVRRTSEPAVVCYRGKGFDLLEAVKGTPIEAPSDRRFVHIRQSFLSIPNCSLSYDLPRDLWELFEKGERLEPTLGVARQGLGISDSWRWYRLRAEVPPNVVGKASSYVTLANGGGFAPFYRDLDLLLFWRADGEDIKRAEAAIYKSWSRTVKNVSYYFQRGVSFPKRTDDLNAHILPDDCIFTVEGLGFFCSGNDDERWWALSLLNSRFYSFVINTYCGQHKHVGYIKQLPYSQSVQKEAIISAAQEAYELKRRWATHVSTSPLFLSPALLSWHTLPFAEESELPQEGEPTSGRATRLRDQIGLIENALKKSTQRLGELQQQIDEGVFDAFRLSDETKALVLLETSRREELTPLQGIWESVEQSPQLWVQDLVSYAVMTATGRADIRLRAQGLQRKERFSAFDAVPPCAPGMLLEPNGLPARTAPEGYPIEIGWAGILVDDPGHPNDVVGRTRRSFEIFWEDKAERREAEACEILGVKELREYFRKPGRGGFWDDHVAQYSKRSRKAPIYWLLQSVKRNYAIWFYYSRLDKDSLFKALVNYVEPKLRLEEDRLQSLRTEKTRTGDSGKEAKRLAKDLERQEDFISELRDFEEKIRRAADLHLEPDLNDGVVLNIAPLYELVPWKVAKDYWDELLEGKYEWSSIGKQLRQKGLVK